MDKGYTANVIQEVLEHAIGTPLRRDVIETYVESWYRSKEPWIKRFGGTIYTAPEPVTCVLRDGDKLKNIESFICTISNSLEIMSNFRYSFSVFKDFMNSQGVDAAENLVSTDFVCPDGTKIPKGMKLLRAFKFFFKDKDILCKVQDMMNLVISKNKLTGYLHLSVDPLDYLSVSENSYGWRSCHSLDGDYAVGNLEYMMDTSTIVCYIDDGNKVKINGFPETIPWNSKKWRMLLFMNISGTTIFAGRQYPDAVDQVLYEVQLAIENLFPDNYYNFSWENEYITKPYHTDLRCKHIKSKFDGCIYPLHALYYEDRMMPHLFYSDILHSTVYKKPYFLLGQKLDTTKALFPRTLEPIEVGGSIVMCPRCGKRAMKPGIGWDCDCNESSWVCSCCGRHFKTEAEGNWVGQNGAESWWCSDCITDNCVICEQCGAIINYEETYFDDITGNYYCENCWEDM